MKKILSLASCVALGVLAPGAQVSAGVFPERAITIIVPFAAGGPNDVLGRIVANHMSKTLGQPVLIENLAGAGGTIGSAKAAKSDPDGYTIVSGNLGSHGASYSYYEKPGYKPEDFAGIGMVAGTPNFIAIRKGLPFKTLADFISEAKKSPGKFTFGHAGNGSNGNLVCLLFEAKANIQLQLVPYRGSGPAMNDLLGGQIDGMCDSSPTIVPQAQGGTINVLVTAQPDKVSVLPDVPTNAEAGVPDFDVTGWNAFLVPKATPTAIIATLNKALNDALADRNVQSRIQDIGATLPPAELCSPAGLDDFVKAEIRKWGDVVKNANASMK